jgi:hypothetical protein
MIVVAADLDGHTATARVGDLLGRAPRRHTFRAAAPATER